MLRFGAFDERNGARQNRAITIKEFLRGLNDGQINDFGIRCHKSGIGGICLEGKQALMGRFMADIGR